MGRPISRSAYGHHCRRSLADTSRRPYALTWFCAEGANDSKSAGVTTTPSGRNFLRHARPILEQIDSLVVTAHRTSQGEAGQLSIGFYTSPSAGNLHGNHAL